MAGPGGEGLPGALSEAAARISRVTGRARARIEGRRSFAAGDPRAGPAGGGGGLLFGALHGFPGDFAEQDRRPARHFVLAARRAGLERIVYLGGLGKGSHLSPHLASRQEVGRILRSSGVPTVELRASVILGSGSLSFELIRALVERLPLLLTPRWVHEKAQPLAIEDVIAYLLEAVEVEAGGNPVFEIGGPERVSYAQLMQEYARQRGLRRWILPVPVLTPRLSSLWLGLLTPVYARTGRKLIDSLRNSTVVHDPRAGGDSRERRLLLSPAVAFRPVRRISGATGWCFGDWLWKLRGLLDLAAGGVGTRRGRGDPEMPRVGRPLDFWRVEAYEPERLLRVVAEMKLPGRARLQFEVEPEEGGSRLRQTALFDPHGLAGLLYWYTLYPIHRWVFSGMLRRVAEAAEREV